MAVPLRAAGLSATTTYNLLVMAGFALSAWAMWRVVTDWTGDPVAGAVAGMAFAFNAHLLTRFAHLQALHAEFVPLVLLAVDRVARHARRRDGVLLGVAIALAGLVSIYQLAFVAGATVVALLARRGDWQRAPRATLRAALIGVGLSVVLLGPMLWQYVAVTREFGFTRTLAETARYGATWRNYLATGGRLHFDAVERALRRHRHRALPRRRRDAARGRGAVEPAGPTGAACACAWPSACSGWRYRSARPCPSTSGSIGPCPCCRPRAWPRAGGSWSSPRWPCWPVSAWRRCGLAPRPGPA